MHSKAFDKLAARAGRSVLLPYYKHKFDQFARTLDAFPQRQERFLLDLLARTAGTRFGRMYGLDKVRSVSDFRKAIPIQSYESLRPYLDEEAAGARNAIIPLSDAIKAFACTTGTTGKSKLLPVTQRWLSQYQANWRMWGAKCIADHENIIGTRWLQISGPMDVGTTGSGLKIGMASAISARFQNPIFNVFHAVPATVGDISESEARYYAILRLAMAQNVGFLITITAANFLKLARLGDTHKETLIRDIHDGSFKNLDSVRQHLPPRALAFASRPSRDRAKELEQLASRNDGLYPKHYWDLRLLCCWLGGTVGYQSKELHHYYGDVARRDIGYISTEGRHSVPLSDTDPAGPLIPDGTFFEFQPEGSDDIVSAQDLEPGVSYSVVLTSTNGLFRYAIGDIVRCKGFMSRTPLIEFLHKSSDVSDLEGEKLSAEQAVTAGRRALESLRLAGTFSLMPTRAASGQAHYSIVMEESREHENLYRKLPELFDAGLKTLNIVYYQKRSDGSLTEPTLTLIPQGSWERLAEVTGRKRGTGESQFKHPIFIDAESIQLLPKTECLSAA